MSFIGSMFSNDMGAGYQAQMNPNLVKGANINGVPIQEGTNVGQVGNAYGQAQGGLSQQQAFVNALAAQGGLGNQSNVFAQQQGLANQLGQQAMGEGPNPALAQLANTTGQNIAQQSALMGSQRGTGANTGLIARQAALQGAGIQQQAAGQAAVLRAQQQLAAQQALQQQQGLMGNMANQQVGQQANALSGYNQLAQNQQQSLLGALAQQNAANVGMQSNINNANVGMQSNINNALTAQQNTTNEVNQRQSGLNTQGQQQIVGGIMNGAGAAMMAHGGMIKGYADGGDVFPGDPTGPQSFAGKFLMGATSTPEQQTPGMYQAGQGMGKGMGMGLKSLFSPGAAGAGTGGGMAGAGPSMGPMVMAAASSGGSVPGKASQPGDSLKNDNVPAMLSPGEVVIPRSVMNSKDAPERARKFVEAILAKKGMGKKK